MVDAQRRRLTVSRADQAVKGAGVGGGILAQILADNKKAGTETPILSEEQKNVTCIHSITDTDLKKKRSFAEKDRVSCEGGKFLEGKDATASLDGVYFACKKGLKPESPNQDSYVIVSCPKKWGLYGVFDGHGPNGHDVSDFAVKTLVQIFLGEENFATETEAAFTKAFTECQKSIEAVKKAEMDSSSSGTTCTMAFHNFETDVLTLGHVGDSRGVLYVGNGTKPDVIIETEDHKPNLPGEKARIEKMGGRVVFDGYYNYRVFAKAGMYPGLNMSRALGDVVAHKEAGLTAEPEINKIELKQHRDKDKGKLTLLICSDGVWEFIKSEEAPQQLDNAGKIDLTKVEVLAKKSWDSWMEDSDNEISDDITVIGVAL